MIAVSQKDGFLPFKRVLSFMSCMAVGFCKEKDDHTCEIISNFKGFTLEQNINCSIDLSIEVKQDECYILDIKHLLEIIGWNMRYYSEEERPILNEFHSYIFKEIEIS